MNILYKKEPGKLVAVPGMEKPDKENFKSTAIAGGGYRVTDWNRYEAALKRYNQHLATLPQPIDTTPDFEEYTKNDPEGKLYEVGVHFYARPCCESKCDGACERQKSTLLAYPIQKAEPAKVKATIPPELIERWKQEAKQKYPMPEQPEFWETHPEAPKDSYIGYLFGQFQKRTIYVEGRKDQYQSAAAPAPLPDNWNEWVREQADAYYEERRKGRRSITNAGDCAFHFKQGIIYGLNKLLPELERLKEALRLIRETGIGWDWGEDFWAVKIATDALNRNLNPELCDARDDKQGT